MQRNSKLQMLITTRLKTRNYQETVIAFEKCIEHLFKTRAPEGNNNMPKTLTECIKYLKETFGYNFGLLNFEHNQNDEVGVLPTKIHITPVDKEQKSELFVQIEGGMLLLARKAKAPKKTQTQEPDDVVLVRDQDDSEESSEESSDGGEDSASDSDTSNTNTANTDSNESSSDSSSSSSEEGDSSNAESNSENEIEKEEDEADD
jgi:DNA mismatch repair ATPase MutL